MRSFIKHVEGRAKLSDEDWSLIKPQLRKVSVKKNQTLTEQGSIESKLYFVEEGVLRLYHERDDREITANFGFPNSFISSYTSFLTKEKSEFTLETLTSCVLTEIEKTALEDIYQNTSRGDELGRIFSEEIYLYMSRRETDFMLKSPTQRYLDLFNQQPHLIREIPLKYLASYVGVTPQALSRIRAKI